MTSYRQLGNFYINRHDIAVYRQSPSNSNIILLWVKGVSDPFQVYETLEDVTHALTSDDEESSP